MSELVRFWLEACQGCLLRESVPVPVPFNLSDIDFVAMRPDLQSFRLPTGEAVGPRLIVETKDEHDFDPSASDFLKTWRLWGTGRSSRRRAPTRYASRC